MCSFAIRIRRKICLERSRTESIRMIYQNALIHDETRSTSIPQSPVDPTSPVDPNFFPPSLKLSPTTNSSINPVAFSTRLKNNIQTLNEIHSELDIQEKKYLPPSDERQKLRRILFRVKFICRGRSKLQATLEELGVHNGNLERMLETEVFTGAHGYSGITQAYLKDIMPQDHDTRLVPEINSGSIDAGSNERSSTELVPENPPTIIINTSSTRGSLASDPGAQIEIQNPSLLPSPAAVMERLVINSGLGYDTSTGVACTPIAGSGESISTTGGSIYSGSEDGSEFSPSTPRSEFSIAPWDNNSVHSLDQICENCHYIIRGPRSRYTC